MCTLLWAGITTTSPWHGIIQPSQILNQSAINNHHKSKESMTLNKGSQCSCVYYPVPDTSGDGVLFLISLFVCMYLFLSFFVSLLARLRKNGWTDLHEIFREGAEWPWDDLIQFLVNSEKPCDAVMSNTGTEFVVLSHHILLDNKIYSGRTEHGNHWRFLTWKEKYQHLEIKVEWTPRGWLMLRHGSNDWNVILGIWWIK